MIHAPRLILPTIVNSSSEESYVSPPAEVYIQIIPSEESLSSFAITDEPLQIAPNLSGANAIGSSVQ